MFVDLICFKREKEILLKQGWNVDQLKGPPLIYFVANALDDIADLTVGYLDLLVWSLLVSCSGIGEEEQEHNGD